MIMIYIYIYDHFSGMARARVPSTRVDGMIQCDIVQYNIIHRDVDGMIQCETVQCNIKHEDVDGMIQQKV
jgi:hypothetical protein